MQYTALYTYHCRPGYGSHELLIEFIRGAEQETFFSDLLDAIKSLHPQLTGMDDLWMNDEIVYTVTSGVGAFTLSIDIWNFAFILSENNQDAVLEIDTLLYNDTRFEKIEVDFTRYTLKE